MVGLDVVPQSRSLLRFLNVYPPALPGACAQGLLSCMFFSGRKNVGLKLVVIGPQTRFNTRSQERHSSEFGNPTNGLWLPIELATQIAEPANRAIAPFALPHLAIRQHVKRSLAVAIGTIGVPTGPGLGTRESGQLAKNVFV